MSIKLKPWLESVGRRWSHSARGGEMFYVVVLLVIEYR